MKILSVEHHETSELIQKLRNVSMLHDKDTYPYRDTTISIEAISTDYLSPPQTYVLNSELKIKRALRWALQEKQIDLFNLDSYITMSVEYGTEDRWMGIPAQIKTIELLPPVVEESIENDGKVHCLINDGMHRIYLARIEGIIPKVLYIRGVPKHLPYYAFPIKDDWFGVDLRSDLPDSFVKKWHRVKDYKKLYRNFNSVFQNTSAPRGNFSNGEAKA